MTPFLAVIPLAAFGLWIFHKCRKANVFIWLPSYLRGNWAGKRETRSVIRGRADAHPLLHRRPL